MLKDQSDIVTRRVKKKFFLPIDFSWSICWEKWLRFDENFFSNLRKNHNGGPFWFFNLIFKKLINNWFLSQKRHFHFIFTVFDHEESIGDVFGSNFLVEKIIFFRKNQKMVKIVFFQQNIIFWANISLQNRCHSIPRYWKRVYTLKLCQKSTKN